MSRGCWCGREHKPAFHIYQDGPWWRWCCTLCQPPVRGARWHHYYGGIQRCLYRTVIGVSMRRHFQVREYHHRHVASLSR